MNSIIKACLLIWIESSYAEFFHRFSIKSLEKPNTDFGYSLGYQEQKRSLVVGAPHADLDGRVYACDLETNDCPNIMGPHNLTKNLWGNYSRHDSPNQHFCLGASVAVTADYVFTCAPLLTAYIEYYEDDKLIKTNKFKTIGTCFIEKDASVQPYNSIMNSETSNGAVGWSVVVDQENDIIVINKPEQGKIMYTSAKNPMQQTASVNWKEMDEYICIGRALTKGVFFQEYKTVYAFSLEHSDRQRFFVAFLHYADNNLKLIISPRTFRMKYIRNDVLGNMFGSVLNAADFNQDEYSELLVGAPTQAYKDAYETGAVYIYLGGEKVRKTPRHICIIHNKEGSRFGSAIATADLDEDNLPDLFVSAPYENEGGAVYVISGFRVRRLLERKDSQCIYDKEVFNQRISGSSKSFGFALQPLVNFPKNGANGLATSSPSASTVTIYRSIPAVNVTISARLKDKKIVRELDENFTVTVEVNVNFSRPNISGVLIVKNTIDQGMGASIDDKYQTFTIDLSLSPSNITKDITVKLDDQEPRTYKFVSSVETVTSLLHNKEYSESLVRLSEYSEDKYELSIMRRCKGDECVPRLRISNVKWMGRYSNHYVLGSSQNEMITVAIKNDGSTSYESCAKIKVTGAKMSDWSCYPAEVTDVNSQQQLMCNFAVLQEHKEEILNIILDMSQTSSKNEKLEFEVFLYNKCSTGIASGNFSKTILYQLQTTDISLNGSSLGQNVTDRELAENKDSTFDIQDKFTINNNGSVNWEDVQATIKLSRESYIQDFSIKIYPEEIENCKRNVEEDNFFARSCSLNLTRGTMTILTTAKILKDKIVSAQSDKLQLSYELQLHLLPTTEIKSFTLNSTRVYVKDAQVGTNKTYILIIAIVLATIILIVLGAILYKFGFFKRTAKKELENLREEARQRSFRPPYYLIDDASASSFDTQQTNRDAPQQENAVQINKMKEIQSVKM